MSATRSNSEKIYSLGVLPPVTLSRPRSGAIGEIVSFARIPEKLFEKAPCGHLDKRLRLPVCQDDHACLGGWSQHDRSAETWILAVMINQVHAANVSGEPA